jgi:uncharacterized protein YukE
MSSSSSGYSPPPPPPPPPPPIHTSMNLWDPVGDPSKLRECAEAWSSLARSLDSIGSRVHSVTSALGAHWSGEAYEKFSNWSGRYHDLLSGMAEDCRSMAGQLNQTADYLQEKNDEIHALYEAIAVTAVVGIGLSIVTFGFSDAAAAVTAAGEVAEAEGILAAIGSFLSAMADSMGATLASFAARWAMAFSLNLTIDAAVNLIERRPLLSVNTFTSAINGATFSAVLPEQAFADWRFGGAMKGALTGFSTQFANEWEEGGNPLSLRSLGREFTYMGISAVIGQAFSGSESGSESEPEPTSNLINPSTGLPFGATPPPVTLVGPDGVPIGGTPEVTRLINPSTGLPFGATPPPVTLVGPDGQVIGAPPEPVELVGPDGRPLSHPSSPAVGIPVSRRVVGKLLANTGKKLLVDLLFPTGNGRGVVEQLVIPISDLPQLGPAPVATP